MVEKKITDVIASTFFNCKIEIESFGGQTIKIPDLNTYI
jgi:hypothetical protein